MLQTEILESFTTNITHSHFLGKSAQKVSKTGLDTLDKVWALFNFISKE
jgi:hypothetical protein